MKVAIVGGGITGLVAAYELAKSGHTVSVFEKESFLGGFAHGFKPARNASHSDAGGSEGWEWPLEAFYHHFFTNDAALIRLAQELNLADQLIIKRPVTATFIPTNKTNGAVSPAQRDEQQRRNAGKIFQLDSPLHLLKFDQLSLPDRLRTGAMLAFCRLNPFWQPLEGITAEHFIQSFGGNAGWKILWEPLLYGKFNDYAPRIAASWFWARIRKRTTRLGYFHGGFQTLIDRLTKAIITNGGKILTNTAIESVKYEVGSKKYENKQSSSCFIIHASCFDAVLLTTPTPITTKLLPLTTNNQPRTTNNQPLIPHLHAQMLILETKEPILKDTYWLNINNRSFPFLAVVAHTNFIDKKYYGNHHITYFGNYLPDNHPYLKMNAKQLYELFLPYIKKINPSMNYELKTVNSFLFTGMYAQPVHTLHYSKLAPCLMTHVPGIYLANMDSIYPWDRGVNYAVELGKKAAEQIGTYIREI